jgi:hypothetical protein
MRRAALLLAVIGAASSSLVVGASGVTTAHPKAGGSYVAARPQAFCGGEDFTHRECTPAVHIARHGSKMSGHVIERIEMHGHYWACDCASEFSHLVYFRGRVIGGTRFKAETPGTTVGGDSILRKTAGAEATDPWPCPCEATYRAGLVRGPFYRPRLGVFQGVKAKFRVKVRVTGRDGLEVGRGFVTGNPSTSFKARLVHR